MNCLQTPMTWKTKNLGTPNAAALCSSYTGSLAMQAVNSFLSPQAVATSVSATSGSKNPKGDGFVQISSPKSRF